METHIAALQAIRDRLAEGRDFPAFSMDADDEFISALDAGIRALSAVSPDAATVDDAARKAAKKLIRALNNDGHFAVKEAQADLENALQAARVPDGAGGMAVAWEGPHGELLSDSVFQSRVDGLYDFGDLSAYRPLTYSREGASVSNAVRGLVAKFRERQNDDDASCDEVDAYGYCADELEAALATPNPTTLAAIADSYSGKVEAAESVDGLTEAERLERGRKAWADVPDAAEWQREIRGNSDPTPASTKKRVDKLRERDELAEMIAERDERVWALIEVAETNGARRDMADDGSFWTLDFGDWIELESALRLGAPGNAASDREHGGWKWTITRN